MQYDDNLDNEKTIAQQRVDLVIRQLVNLRDKKISTLQHADENSLVVLIDSRDTSIIFKLRNY